MNFINNFISQMKSVYRWARESHQIHIFSLILCAVALIVFATNLITHVNRPLWLDEAWRAYVISNDLDVSEADKFATAIAPITLGHYIVTKALTIIYDFEFTQRLLSYVCSILLLIALFIFGKEVKNKYFGIFLIGAIGMTGYFLEYSTSNKSYITDALAAVIIIYSTFLYITGRKGILFWILTAILTIIFSFASFFVLIASLIVMTIDKIRKLEIPVKEIIAGIIVVIAMLIYYIYFVRPQYNEALNDWWKDLLASEDPLYSVRVLIMNLLSMFGIRFTHLLNVQGYYDVGVLPYISWLQNMDAISQLVGSVYFILFSVSSYMAIKGKNVLIKITSVVILLVLIEQVVTYYLGLWPFGSNRVNVFLYVLIGIMVSWIIFEYFESKKSKDSYLVILILLFCFLFVPARSLARVILIEGSNDYLYLNVRSVAEDLKANANSSDKIIVYHRLAKLPFMYYFCHNDATSVENCDNRDIFYSQYIDETEHSEEFFSMQEADVLWVYMGYGTTIEAIENSNVSYDIEQSTNYEMTGTLYKLVRKDL